jgi:hypothetical protein
MSGYEMFIIATRDDETQFVEETFLPNNAKEFAMFAAERHATYSIAVNQGLILNYTMLCLEV